MGLWRLVEEGFVCQLALALKNLDAQAWALQLPFCSDNLDGLDCARDSHWLTVAVLQKVKHSGARH